MSYNYNAQYKNEVSKHTKKDAVIALSYYVFYIATMIGLGFYRRHFQQTILISIIFGVLVIGVCLIIVYVKKDRLTSLGFRCKNVWKSLRLGFIFGFIPLAIVSLLLHFISGLEFRSFDIIILSILNILMFAFGEDIIFIGYIQTRIYGLIKKDILAILFVAFLFAIMHFPIQVVQHGSEFGTAIGGLVGGSIWFFSCILCHFLFNAVFRRYVVLLPAVILHTANNINSTGSLWIEQSPFWAVPVYFTIVTSAIIIWTVWLRRNEKKNIINDNKTK